MKNSFCAPALVFAVALILFSGFALAETSYPQLQGHKGWNIIPAGADYSGCNASAIYSFSTKDSTYLVKQKGIDNVTREYGVIDPAAPRNIKVAYANALAAYSDDIKNDYLTPDRAGTGVFAYFTDACKVNLSGAIDPPKAQMRLFKGTNFVSANSLMRGRNLTDWFASCTVSSAWSFDAANQKWVNEMHYPTDSLMDNIKSEAIDNSKLGKVYVVSVVGDCPLGTEPARPVLRPIPDKQITVNSSAGTAIYDLWDYVQYSGNKNLLSFGSISNASGAVQCSAGPNAGNGHQIVCAKPTGMGNGTVTVSIADPKGRGISDTVNIKVAAAPNTANSNAVKTDTIPTSIPTITRIDPSSGPVGTEVKIYGTNMGVRVSNNVTTSNVAAKINGQEMQKTSTIVANTGSVSAKIGTNFGLAPGIYDIKLEGPAGNSNSVKFEITAGTATQPAGNAIPKFIRDIPATELRTDSPALRVFDLWDYASDAEDSKDKLKFNLIQPGYLPIQCSIVSNRYLNCDKPMAGGSSEKTLTVEDTKGAMAVARVIITIKDAVDPPVLSGLEPNAASPYDAVTAKGRNFTATGNKVTIGGAEISGLVSYNYGTVIKFQVPGLNDDEYDLKVSNSKGTSLAAKLIVNKPKPAAVSTQTRFHQGERVVDIEGSGEYAGQKLSANVGSLTLDPQGYYHATIELYDQGGRFITTGSFVPGSGFAGSFIKGDLDEPFVAVIGADIKVSNIGADSSGKIYMEIVRNK